MWATNNITTVTENTSPCSFSTRELLLLIDRPRSLKVINMLECFCFWMLNLRFISQRISNDRDQQAASSFSAHKPGSQELGLSEWHQRKPPFWKLLPPKVPNAYCPCRKSAFWFSSDQVYNGFGNFLIAFTFSIWSKHKNVTRINVPKYFKNLKHLFPNQAKIWNCKKTRPIFHLPSKGLMLHIQFKPCVLGLYYAEKTKALNTE